MVGMLDWAKVVPNVEAMVHLMETLREQRLALTKGSH